MELIFLGTGSSAGLPYIDCITAPPEREPCKTCLSALTPKGKRNIRRNTSAVVRLGTKEGRKATIVIDVGKTFQASALEWFPKHGMREIDAILITHAHADALNGLDDLRSWTLYGLIQPHIDIYLSQETFDAVKTSFPYLVSKERASGGGDVPEFKWHIIHDKVPFEINNTGIHVTPFSGRVYAIEKSCCLTNKSVVHHGFHSSSSPQDSLQTSPSFSLFDEMPCNMPEKREIFLSFGYKIDNQLVYISDASFIPEESWDIISSEASGYVPVCVLDCLQLKPHISHFHLAESVASARRIGAARTYLTGFCHAATHEEYVAMGEIVGGALKDQAETSALRTKGFSLEKGVPIWIRPAHDGLRVTINNGIVWDETYLNQLPPGELRRSWTRYLRRILFWKRPVMPSF
ncbi:beta-lactamase-like protein [Collybia nuda]|uniref:Beta-lactamase-like protein n=1 Tax=Collybia nuda TaxID=64659 RepID=A0A9P5Y5X1_9AGAR|nr:beta-lactamase-like protein [Collybia nuda]